MTHARLLGLICAALLAIPSAAAFGVPDAEEGREREGTRGHIVATLTPSPDQAPQLSPDREADLAVLADEHDLHPDEARRRFGWQDDAALAVTRLKEAWPENFTYALVDSSADPHLTIAFKGAPPDHLDESFEGLPVPVHIIADVGYSEIEFHDEVADSHYGAIAHYGTQHIASGGDPVNGEIEVVVDSRQINRLNLDDVKPSAALKGANVSVRHEPVAVGHHDTILGGGALSTCTAGWPVNTQANPSVVGVTTAAHCGNNQDYFGRDVLEYVAAMTSTRGDVQWHRAYGEAIDNGFYTTSSTTRAVTAAADPLVNQTLYRYGRTTGQENDTVFGTGRCRGNYCGLVVMDHDEASSGDSGGPWFSGNTAYGVHSGACYRSGTSGSLGDCFTPVRAANSALALWVRTY